MIVKLHSRCNLDCAYCYMYQHGDNAWRRMPKRMPLEVIEAIPSMYREYHARFGGDKYVRLSFHGGEPLLVGKRYFAEIMDILSFGLEGFNTRYTLQTNATLVDEEWIDLFNKYGIDVCASLDGPPDANRINRVDKFQNDSSQRAIRGVRLLQRHAHKFSGVIAVADYRVDGSHVADFFIEDLELEWFDILLPDYTHDSLPEGWAHMTTGLTEYMTSAFDRWYRDCASVSCRFFESIIARLLGKPSTVDTLSTSKLTQVTIETDGSLEPNDVVRICLGEDRSTGIQVGPDAIERLYESPSYLRFSEPTDPVSIDCLHCEKFGTCGGGHFTHRYSQQSGFSNRSVHCQTLFSTIDHVERFLGQHLLSRM